MTVMSDVTRIIEAAQAGDCQAANQLLPLVYDELRKIAAARLASEKPGQTLQATALVHEAYLRLLYTPEAQEIIANAKAEAERIAVETKAKMEDFVARRTKTAESKIALAETQALADVRAAAANAAVSAASTILSQSVKGSVADDLLAKGIAEVRAKLN